jgi:small subunit ribosomal protein S20
MANTKSAEKRYRQSQVRRDRNRIARSELRTAIKKLRSTVASGDAKAAAALLPATFKVIDTTARKRVIHPNTAARYKSRLAHAVASAPGAVS